MSKTGWSILIAVAIFLVVLIGAGLILPIACGSGYGSGYGGMMGPWMMGGYGIFGAVLGLLFLVIVVGGAAWLVVALARGTGSGASSPRGDAPLDILKRRYAGGEITKEQYDDMKRQLGS
jgi:putative membrane protein